MTDKIKLGAAVVLVALGIWGYYLLGEQALVLRASAGLATGDTADGSRFGGFRLGESQIGMIAASRRPLWSNALQSEPWLFGAAIAPGFCSAASCISRPRSCTSRR